MVESSVKTISKPVIDRLPVNQIDEFACRQLDRVSYNFLKTSPIVAPPGLHPCWLNPTWNGEPYAI